MPRRPRAVQPWSSAKAARRALELEFGSVLIVESLLSSIECEVVVLDSNVRANRLRKYREQVAQTMESLTALTALADEFGFPDRRALELAIRKVNEVRNRHAARTDPLPVLNADGSVRYQVTSQLLSCLGHGSEHGGDVDSLRGLAATIGALRWFERCVSEVAIRPNGRILFLCAVAIGLEQASADSNSIKGGLIDRAQRRWKERIADVRRQASARGSRTHLARVARGNWEHRTESERRQIRADIRALERNGQQIEAFARRLDLGVGE